MKHFLAILIIFLYRIPVTVNYLRLKHTNGSAVFIHQYHVTFEPNVDSRNARSALLFQHGNVIGKARTFDGNTLFLPVKLDNEVILIF